jgi:carboxyl-terminal processing protease
MYKEIQVETKGEFGGVGIQIGIKDNRLAVIAPIEGTPAQTAGIKSGEFIIKVNDETT